MHVMSYLYTTIIQNRALGPAVIAISEMFSNEFTTVRTKLRRSFVRLSDKNHTSWTDLHSRNRNEWDVENYEILHVF